MQKGFLEPHLCMQRDQEAIAFVYRHLAMAEPCAVLEMIDMGKDIVFNNLVEELTTKKSPYFIQQIPYIIQSVHVTDDTEFADFIDKQEKLDTPIILLINITSSFDLSPFIARLTKLRVKRSTYFVSVIFSNTAALWTALLGREKILTQSLSFLTPIKENDALILTKDFEKRFAFSLSDSQRKELYKLSDGHVGLLKSLSLLRKEHPSAQFSTKFLLKQDSIIFRLHRLQINLPKKLVNGPLLENMGVFKKGKIFSKLFTEFLHHDIEVQDLNTLLTKQEKDVLSLLKDNHGKLTTKEQIALHMWKDEWVEKYSDWAIDQIIHRIREKIIMSDSAYNLTTKKGEGFILHKLK